MESDYKFDIEMRPDFSVLRLHLMAGQEIFVEPSAMASMDTGVTMRSALRGGVLRSVGRVFGGESLVVNTFTSQQDDQELLLAPGPLGDLEHYRLTGQSLFLQRGAFVAHGPGVEMTAKWQGFKGFFSGEGLVLLKVSGQGDVFFNTYGAMIPIDVNGDYLIDTGYVVAFEDTLSYEITTLPGLSVGSKVKTFFFGGEGLVCRFRGQGRVWLQTRSINPFLSWVNPYRPVGRDA